MNTQLWSARSLIPDRRFLRYPLRKLRTIDYCKPRQCYPIWRYRRRPIQRYSVYQIRLYLVFQRIQSIELLTTESDSEEAETVKFSKKV